MQIIPSIIIITELIAIAKLVGNISDIPQYRCRSTVFCHPLPGHSISCAIPSDLDCPLEGVHVCVCVCVCVCERMHTSVCVCACWHIIGMCQRVVLVLASIAIRVEFAQTSCLLTCLSLVV